MARGDAAARDSAAGHRRLLCALLPPCTALLLVLFGLSSVAVGEASPATVSDITYIVPAGQPNDASKPTLTGGGQYSYFAPTFDRAAKNHYPHRARLLGEVYLGNGGATATYTIKTLSPTPRSFSFWIYYDDDGLHPSGTRAVVVSIPKLNWSMEWSSKSEDTRGWKAVKIATITTSGDFTLSFRKKATTSAAFIMNAFALTSGHRSPAFAPAPAAATAGPTGLWRLSLNQRTYRFVPISGGFEQRTVDARKSDLGCLIPAGTAVYRYVSLGSGVYQFRTRNFQPRSGGVGPAGKNCTISWKTSKASVKIDLKATTMKVACIQTTVKANTEAYTCYTGVYSRVGP